MNSRRRVNSDVGLLVQPAAKRRQKVARGKRAARRPWITSERLSAPCGGAMIGPGVSETRDDSRRLKAGAGIKGEMIPGLRSLGLAHPGLLSVAAPRLLRRTSTLTLCGVSIIMRAQPNVIRIGVARRVDSSR